MPGKFYNILAYDILFNKFKIDYNRFYFYFIIYEYYIQSIINFVFRLLNLFGYSNFSYNLFCLINLINLILFILLIIFIFKT